jgi:hypothetical protein
VEGGELLRISGSTEGEFLDKRSDCQLVSVVERRANTHNTAPTGVPALSVWSTQRINIDTYVCVGPRPRDGQNKRTSRHEVAVIGLSWTAVVDLSSVLFDPFRSEARGNDDSRLEHSAVSVYTFLLLLLLPFLPLILHGLILLLFHSVYMCMYTMYTYIYTHVHCVKTSFCCLL